SCACPFLGSEFLLAGSYAIEGMRVGKRGTPLPLFIAQTLESKCLTGRVLAQTIDTKEVRSRRLGRLEGGGERLPTRSEPAAPKTGATVAKERSGEGTRRKAREPRVWHGRHTWIGSAPMRESGRPTTRAANRRLFFPSLRSGREGSANQKSIANGKMTCKEKIQWTAHGPLSTSHEAACGSVGAGATHLWHAEVFSDGSCPTRPNLPLIHCSPTGRPPQQRLYRKSQEIPPNRSDDSP